MPNLVGNPEDRIILDAASLITAKVNAGKPENKDVLQVVKLAVKLRYWAADMDELFTYRYQWEASGKYCTIFVRQKTLL